MPAVIDHIAPCDVFCQSFRRTSAVWHPIGIVRLSRGVLALLNRGRLSGTAGSVCGGSAFFVLTRITLPLIAVGIVQGFIMIFIIVLRELVAASLISPPDVLVISTFIVNEFEQGSASVAMAMALICVLVSALMLFALRMLLSRMKHISAV